MVFSTIYSHYQRNQRFYSAILLGQCISILIAGTGIFSTYLANDKIFIPTSQSTINYTLLFIFYISYRTYYYRQLSSRNPLSSSSSLLLTSLSTTSSSVTDTVSSSNTSSIITTSSWFSYIQYLFTLSVPWYYYLILAIADVEANYVIVQAYHYTTITSIMLLDCSTIPMVMVLSYYFLQRKYNKYHFIGIGICLIGIGLLILSDVLNTSSSSSDNDNNTSSEDQAPISPFSNNALWGDFLCIIASILYAISNVGQEYLVKTYNRNEFLGMIGGIGIIISTFQVIITGEYRNYTNIVWTITNIGSFFGFGLCLFFMYMLTSYFLVVCDATIFNLSLLTSDIWAIIASYLLFNNQLHWLYFIALLIIILGLYIYHYQNTIPTTDDNNSNTKPNSLVIDTNNTIPQAILITNTGTSTIEDTSLAQP